ncbi:MAG: CDGSH iron-sulfur domain-containing protein [Nitrospiria bacterium]
MLDNHTIRIKVMKDGPYEVTGADLVKMNIVLNPAGRPISWARGAKIDHAESYLLCRCGHSSNKPFCDWAHVSEGFDGTETADPTPTARRRETYPGHGIVLTDDKTLCVHAGFCVTEKTEVWDLIDETTDPAARAEVIQMVRNCPAGRFMFEGRLRSRGPEERPTRSETG